MTHRTQTWFSRNWLSCARPRLKGKALGAYGEKEAELFLEQKGFLVVRRNWKCRIGEIDLICWHGDSLVFVEVKTRNRSPLAEKYLLENITARKQRKLRLLAECYLANKRLKPKAVRIDVVGVIADPNRREPAQILHLKAAV